MIKFLVMDVDGTLTDGKIYIGAQGEILKAFSVKDGYGIKEILPSYSITPVIITARSSEILINRCKELGISELHQNTRDKIHCLDNLLKRHHSNLSEIAYIGDDCLDLPCMQAVANAGGLAGCPANAAPAVIAASHFIAPHNAGEGAVRDFIEYIVNHPDNSPNLTLKQRLDKAVTYIDNLDHNTLSLGRHDVSPDFYFNVIEYTPSSQPLFESHRKYIDIQRLFHGEEIMMVTDTSTLSPATPYDDAKDVILYHDHPSLSQILLRPGSSLVLLPNNAHKATCIPGKTTKVKKIVGKLLITA